MAQAGNEPEQTHGAIAALRVVQARPVACRPVSLHGILAVTPTADDSFEATPDGEGFFFGGLPIGVALRAAANTVAAVWSRSPSMPTSCGPGCGDRHVVRTPDGRSFASRHVTVRQGERTLAVLTLSSHRPGAVPTGRRRQR
jgi:acyl-CoA thioesterase